MAKYREFYIEVENNIDCRVYEGLQELVDFNGYKDDCVHVVEYSALEAERTNTKKLIKMLEEINEGKYQYYETYSKSGEEMPSYYDMIDKELPKIKKDLGYE